VIVCGLILLTVALGRSQETPGTASVPDAGQNAGRSIEEPGNHVAFGLMNYQVRKPDPLHPAHGLYQKGPFGARPFDLASLVAYYSRHSGGLTDSLVASGMTVGRNSPSLTGSYSLRVKSGQYMSIGLSYIHGPAIIPRISDALNFSTSYPVFL